MRVVDALCLRFAPPLQLPESPDTATRAHASLSLAGAGVPRGVGPHGLLSPWIDTRSLRRQPPCADQPCPATVWARYRRRGGVLRGAWLRRHVVGLGPHAPDSRRVDGTAGAQKANMSDLHAARGQDVVQDPAQKLHDVKLGGARAGAAGLAGRAGADTVLERDHTAVGDGHCADRGGEGRQGRGAVRVGLAVHVPGGVPALWGALVDQPGRWASLLGRWRGRRARGP
jgi:hypothetical protein